MAANTTFTTGAVLTAAQMNNLPWGVVAYGARTAGNVTLGPTQADITGMSVTFTAVAGRLYRANWSVNIQKQTSAGWTEAFFTDSANVVYGIAIGYSVAGNYANLSGSTYITGLTAGSKTFKLRLEVESNTAVVIAVSAAPCVMIIEDMGAA
jgi:hypothetical protein